MSDPLIASDVLKAAKRGFIRTASQSIATALASGISIGTLTSILNEGKVDIWTVGIGAAVAVLTPIINGAQSFFSILAAGIPEDYKVGA